MGTNKILVAGLAGGIVAFVVGYLIWGLALMNLMANSAMASVMIDPPVFWAIGVGNLAYGLLMAVIFGRWASIKTLKTGAIAGASIGFLMAVAYDFVMLGTTNLLSYMDLAIDVVASAVWGAFIGATVGLMLGRGVKVMEKAAA